MIPTVTVPVGRVILCFRSDDSAKHRGHGNASPGECPRARRHGCGGTLCHEPFSCWPLPPFSKTPRSSTGAPEREAGQERPHRRCAPVRPAPGCWALSSVSVSLRGLLCPSWGDARNRQPRTIRRSAEADHGSLQYPELPHAVSPLSCPGHGPCHRGGSRG